MLRRVAVALAAALLASLASCASDGIQVTTSFDPLATFPAQGTFVWNDKGARAQPGDVSKPDLEFGINDRAGGSEQPACGKSHVQRA